ncbi:hypothetical protein [Planktothrix agardhii]|nr:hypothetical protein [Planktothrix agardhii]
MNQYVWTRLDYSLKPDKQPAMMNVKNEAMGGGGIANSAYSGGYFQDS